MLIVSDKKNLLEPYNPISLLDYTCPKNLMTVRILSENQS